MAIKSRATVAAVMEEVTEGTYVPPAAGTDVIPLLSGAFEMDPNTEVITSDEIRNSIANSEPSLGIESPTFSLDQYLKHSGVEGQAPNAHELYKAAFGAAEVNTTQYDTVAGSTTTVINVDVGEGATFSKGEGLLIKDGTNGYSINAVHSVSVDALNLAFPIINGAPGTGINLGKAIKYSPVNNGHPALSITYFQGNEGAIEAAAGVKISSLSLEANAGEPIKASFEGEGTKHFFNPITITATSKYIDAEDDGGNFTAILEEKTYKNPEELALEIASKLDAAAAPATTVTASWNPTGANSGKFTITASGTVVFKLEWLTGANTANSAKTKLGFNNTDDTGALTYSSDNVQSYAFPFTASYDSAGLLVAKNQEIRFGVGTETDCYCVQNLTFNLNQEVQSVKEICAETGVSEKLISSRESSLDFVATLKKHDTRPFNFYYNNTTVRFLYSFGEKSGDNFVAGKSGCLYIANAKLSASKVAESDDIVVIEGTLTGFGPADATGEVFLNFL
jgi:hypothetical protein